MALTQNQRRAERGRRVIESHPDRAQLDALTCAADMIADVLHAVALYEGDDNPALMVEETLARAQRCYLGDAEDGGYGMAV